jgi:cyclin H
MTKEITDDDLYRHTSQYRTWSFTVEEFQAKKYQTWKKAADTITAEIREKGLEDEVECLSLEEEDKLIRIYVSKVEAIAQLFHLPSQVRATAISYFHKFYLIHSVMDYHPKNILNTCVFLACKSENTFISIEKFCAAISKTEPKDILYLEFLVLQSLRFTLAVHNPLKSLHGFFLDMQTALHGSLSASDLGGLMDSARRLIIKGFNTNASFFYTPPQIALSALYLVNPDQTLLYINARYPDGGKIAFLLTAIEECSNELQNTTVPSEQEGRTIAKKLHRCSNLDKAAATKRKRSPSSTATPIEKRVKTDTPEDLDDASTRGASDGPPSAPLE